jgi:hypothetical protein
MKRIIKRVLWFGVALLVLLILLRVLLPKPKMPTREELRRHLTESYHKNVQHLYHHEMLALYDPPAEGFTPAGYRLLQDIQARYSKAFLPYLIAGSAIVQQDVLWNPYFDLFILVQDSDGLINSVVLASSLSGSQVPQKDVQEDYWAEIYRRYQIAMLATFTHPKIYTDFSYIFLEMQNLTNKYHWPARLRLTKGRIPFDLYIQQQNQAIYTTPLEPGAYVVFNVVSNKLRTNVMDLPPYVVYQTQRTLQDAIDDDNATGKQLLGEKANLATNRPKARQLPARNIK